MRNRFAFAALLLLACGSLACGSDNSGGSSSSSGGSSSSGSSSSSGGSGSCMALTNLCQRLPTAAVESTCGTGYTKITPVDTSGAGPVNSCTWQKNVSASDEYGISVVYRCLEKVDAHQYFESLISSNPDGERIQAGDEAYFYTDASPFQQATLNYRKGQRVVSSSLHFPDPAPCSPAQAKAHLLAVAEKVLSL